MKRWIKMTAVLVTGLMVLSVFFVWHLSDDKTAPYSGQDSREIAALSGTDVEDLLAGRGWGLARPAELNGFPGPAHVLELSDALSLSSAQEVQVRLIKSEMTETAQALGAEYIAIEAALDDAFEQDTITEDRLVQLTAEAAQVLAQLRNAHLIAHLKVTPLLSEEQIAIYNQKRGYGTHGAHSGHASH
ncbi:MAG: hypothetical protein AAF198_03500 [Pseudomonadota bacterium]